jgi:hypothetical protein
MFKEFSHYTAWTDTMKAARGFVGLIEYQSKCAGSRVNVLWVIAPDCVCEDEAEAVADAMLQEIDDITLAGNVIYSDGVFL